MPATCCSVPGCHERGGHKYPNDTELRNKWTHAVRRLDDRTLKPWVPSSTALVCKRHFTEDDYVQRTILGPAPLKRKLLPTAVPTIFPWTKDNSKSKAERKQRVESREQQKRKWDEVCQADLETSFTEGIEIQEETVECETDYYVATPLEETCPKDANTQTPALPDLSVDKFLSNPAALQHYTGLASYLIFRTVLDSLGEAAYCLRYIYFQVNSVSVENQLFMTLIKLRRYTPNFELSLLFGVSEATVKNIVYTWIVFMSKQWREIDIWGTQDLVRHFAPSDFRQKFPTTRVIVDGTECPIKKPGAPKAQQATFSTYKNRNTVKVLVGATPGGMVNYVSSAYGGSTSDRQIVERGSLVQDCDSGDSVMADKGFNVQDLFATRNVTVNIPTFFRKKNRMSGKTVLKDRKNSSKRVHIERIIGLAKTYTILRNPLTGTESKLASHIIYICFMLCNFRSGIVSKYA